MASLSLLGNEAYYCQKAAIVCAAPRTLGKAGARAYAFWCRIDFPESLCRLKKLSTGSGIDLDTCLGPQFPNLRAAEDIEAECLLRHECSHLTDDPMAISKAQTEALAYFKSSECFRHYSHRLRERLAQHPKESGLVNGIVSLDFDLADSEGAYAFNLCASRGGSSEECVGRCHHACQKLKGKEFCGRACTTTSFLYLDNLRISARTSLIPHASRGEPETH